MALTLTTTASRRICELQNDRDAEFLRLFVESGGCSGFEYGMTFTPVKDGDIRIENEGAILLVDPKSLEKLRGSTIDFDDGLHGKGFEIKNPNAKETCGCGRSFG